MKSTIKNIILEYHNTELPQFERRNINIPINLNIIITLIGARRSGKTYLLYQIIQELINTGCKKEQILFLNFEDERLSLNQQNLDEILQAYQELYPETETKNLYLLFDEIQNVPGWEKFIRRIYDTKTRHIYITGSNSKLLSTEIATELRGRTLTFTIYPLSFNEYLKFNKVEPKLYPQQNKNRIVSYAIKYMLEGSFPETIYFDPRYRIRLLQQYFNVMIFRDIIERYKVSHPETLKFFIKKIFANVTKPFSINKAYHDLQSMGYNISNKYLYEYFSYCNNIFLTQSINKFNYSEIKQEKSDKKTYIIDNGLLSAIEFSVSENKGKLFENMVVMEFFKAEKHIYYFKDYYECDLVISEKESYKPIQISFALDNPETKERELKGIYEACKYLNTNKATIITFDNAELLSFKNIEVQVIPFYEYFLLP